MTIFHLPRDRKLSRRRARRVAACTLLLAFALTIPGHAGVARTPVGSGVEAVAAAIPVRAAAAACRRVAKPRPSHRRFDRPLRVVAPGEALTAVVKTSCGVFRISLDAARAPRTVNSFAFLAERNFYDGLTFHRAVRGFVIQGGDPRGEGTGGPGYRVVETPPHDLSYTKGLVAMAKSATEPSGSSGSQFFVMLAGHQDLPAEYAPVGQVSAGMDVVERIGRLSTPSERPRHVVLIRSIAIRHG